MNKDDVKKSESLFKFAFSQSFGGDSCDWEYSKKARKSKLGNIFFELANPKKDLRIKVKAYQDDGCLFFEANPLDKSGNPSKTHQVNLSFLKKTITA